MYVFFRSSTAKIIIGTSLNENYDIDTEVLTKKKYKYFLEGYKFTSRFAGRCELLVSEIFRELRISTLQEFIEVRNALFKNNISIYSANRYLNFINHCDSKIPDKPVDKIIEKFYKDSHQSNISIIRPNQIFTFLSRTSPSTDDIKEGWYDIDENKILSYNKSKKMVTQFKIMAYKEETCIKFIKDFRHFLNTIELDLKLNNVDPYYTISFSHSTEEFNIYLISGICSIYFQNNTSKSDSKDWIGYTNHRIVKRKAFPIMIDVSKKKSDLPTNNNFYRSNDINLFTEDIALLVICERIIQSCINNSPMDLFWNKSYRKWINGISKISPNIRNKCYKCGRRISFLNSFPISSTKSICSICI